MAGSGVPVCCSVLIRRYQALEGRFWSANLSWAGCGEGEPSCGLRVGSEQSRMERLVLDAGIGRKGRVTIDGFAPMDPDPLGSVKKSRSLPYRTRAWWDRTFSFFVPIPASWSIAPIVRCLLGIVWIYLIGGQLYQSVVANPKGYGISRQLVVWGILSSSRSRCFVTFGYSTWACVPCSAVGPT